MLVYAHIGSECHWRGAMRRLVKSFATIWPVSPASRNPHRHSYTASSFGPSKPSLAQRAHFFGGATGISRRSLEAQGTSVWT